MATLLVLFLVAEIPTAFFNWGSPDKNKEISAANATSPARCFFDMQIANKRFHELSVDAVLSETSAFKNMITTFLLLVFNSFTRVVEIMDRPSAWVTNNLRSPLSRWWRRQILLSDSAFLRSRKAWTPRGVLTRKYFVVKTELAVLLLSRLYADVYTSTPSEVSIRPCPAAVTTVYSLSHVTRYTGSWSLPFGQSSAFLKQGLLLILTRMR